jgi:hypothetical protein
MLLGLLPQSADSQKQKPQFRVEVNLVFLDVEVLDSQGIPIDGLGRNDFVVKENDSPVEISSFARISDQPLSLVISLGTGFMPQTNLGIAKNAVSLLIHLMKPGDEICLYSFDQRDAYLEQGFTHDRPKLVKALENIGVTSRSRRPGRILRGFATPSQTGLGLDLGLAAAKKGIHRRKALLLVRDRVESLGLASLEHARAAGCTLIVLGFSEEAKSRLMLINDQSGFEQLILGSGEIRASGENGEVMELCRTIAHLLSSRYSIGYNTSLTEGQGARRIDVTVPGHDCRIIARRSNSNASRH